MTKYSIVKQPSTLALELAKKTATLRKQKGYSQSELARRSGVSLGSVRRFEQSGKVSLENLLLMAQLLDRLTDFDKILEPLQDLSEVEKLFSDKTRT